MTDMMDRAIAAAKESEPCFNQTDELKIEVGEDIVAMHADSGIAMHMDVAGVFSSGARYFQRARSKRRFLGRSLVVRADLGSKIGGLRRPAGCLADAAVARARAFSF